MRELEWRTIKTIMTKNNESKGMPQDVRTVLMWGLGIGILGMTLLILLIVFGNLSDIGVFARETTIHTNESSNYALNSTVYVLANGVSTVGFVSLTVSAVHNASQGIGTLIPATNYTIDGTAGTITNNSVITYTDINVSYVTTFRSSQELDTDAVIGNYSSSAVNTASQFPVTGTILGIALLLAILIGVLVFSIRKMMGVASSTNQGGRSNSSGGFERGGFG